MMPRIKLSGFLLIATLMPGCMLLGPDYQRPESPLPAQFSADGQPAAGQSEAAISSTWWELYQDPLLNDLVSKALENNTDIKVAVARVEEADAFMREVGAALFPQIDLDAGANRSRISQLGSTPLFNGAKPIRESYNIKLGTSFELDFWGKLRRAKESARAQALSTRYAKDTVALSLAGLVTSNYLQLRSLEAQIDLSEDSLRTRNESLVLTRRRLEGGVSSALDVHQAEVASSNLAAQIVELKRLRAVSEHQLAVLTGILDLNVPAGDITQLPLPPLPPSGIPSSLLEARPDVRQAEEQLVALNANIGVAKAAMFPTISLTANYGGESAELSDVLKSAARIWSGGLSLNLPIFDSGRLSSRLDQATAQQKQALASYEGAVRTAFQEVNDALVTVRQNAEREALLDNSRQAARKAVTISENRYKSGYSAYIDVLDSQRVYNDAALAHIQSRQARLIASVDMFKALGGGWKAEPQGK
ncbi:Outer membrane protein OprM [Methylophilaceae bacterium]|nr:Outer membrane protein OprM [Methylophilaceae bacterium]